MVTDEAGGASAAQNTPPKPESSSADDGRDKAPRPGFKGDRAKYQNKSGRSGFRDKKGRNNGRPGGRGDDAKRSHRDNADGRDGKRRRLDGDGSASNDGRPAWGDDRTRNSGDNFSSHMSIPFSTDEIAAEERRPKRKVAVLIGYAGTGYKGMQINHDDRTIEGDLFAAFVKTGAISKANANDPKKSSLVRCARTDKGVHAAGNVISLKLIIDIDDIVQKLNEALPPQIRVWNMQRTNNGFSCYQACDSRWYEYLLPSYALLPPHPQSYLGNKIREAAREKVVEEALAERWTGVADYWDEVDKNEIQPILQRLSPEVRKEVEQLMHVSSDSRDEDAVDDKAAEGSDVEREPKTKPSSQQTNTGEGSEARQEGQKEEDAMQGTEPTAQADQAPAAEPSNPKLSPAEQAHKEIKAVYIAAKRRYRVSAERLEQLQKALSSYDGTHNFHNYTIQKKHTDPSAKRHIKSFVVNTQPIQHHGTEWLSLKVHGQSFMMHQIRKMVAMAVMIVRCGAPFDLTSQSYGPQRLSIPKAPGLGLLLERPVFDNYNKRAAESFERESIDFAKYEEQIQAFKDKEIYSRMIETEETQNAFHTFFHQLDNFHTNHFLWAIPGGLEVAYQPTERKERVPKTLQQQIGEDGDEAQDTAGVDG